MQLSFFKSNRGATLVEYGIMVGLVSAVSIGSLALMGDSVSETMETSSSEISDANETFASTSTAPQLNELSAAQRASLNANESLVFSDGTVIFMNGSMKEGPQSLELVDASGVTLDWNAPSDCPTGPITQAGSHVINCNYDDASNEVIPLYVRVPGDGYLSMSEKTDWTIISTCSRATSDPADAHEYFCGEAV